MVVILAEGAANKRRTSPCERLELIVAGIHIFDDLLRRQRIVVVVCVGMVHQLAAAVYDGLGLLRILVRPVADDEKGCRDMVFFQCFQNGRCAAVFISGVEGQIDDGLGGIAYIESIKIF